MISANRRKPRKISGNEDEGGDGGATAGLYTNVHL